ncbi:MAG: toxin-antitoxin system HicB family antitoxin [Ruminococcaceae bacterium]|nr:toxin-antitoxin system HicB family antitoxin [Oscillospiraceae bacterium]
MKNKVKFELRLDEDVCRKAAAVAAHEGLTFNNYLVKLLRNSVSYHERVHGRIDPSKSELPEGAEIKE